MLQVSLIAYILAYTLLLGLIVAVGFVLQRSRERAYTGKGIDPESVVVLIPFRNEAHRIPALLESLKQLHSMPGELVFIDDHSEDTTVSLIQEAMQGVPFRVMSLPEEITGKKRALRYATEHTQSEYILTIDADVTLDPDYFDCIAALGGADMYVLPALMIPEGFAEHFYTIDLYLVNAVNAGLAGLTRPIVASGANLLYKRSTFQSVDNFASHAHAASGDDTYLLRDFRLNRTDVRLMTDPKVAVRTETPQSFREFIDQRLRWIGKTGDLKDGLSTSLAVLQAGFTLAFMVLMGWMIFVQAWTLLGLLFALKAFVDMALFYPFFQRTQCLKSWWLIPVYELLFPLYTLVLILLLPVYKPKWKGRAIYSQKR